VSESGKKSGPWGLLLKLLLVGLAFFLISRKVSWNDSLELANGEVLVGTILEGAEPESESVLIRVDALGEERRFAAAEVNPKGRRLGVGSAARHLDLAWVALGMALFLGMYLLGIYRWQLLLRAQGIMASFGRTARLTFMGLFWNNFMPGMTGGDVAKAVLIARENPEKRSAAVSTVIVDRLVGLGALAMISALAISMNFDRFRETGVGIFAVLVACAVAGVCILSRRVRKTLRLDQLMRRLPASETMMKLDAAFLLYRESKGTLLSAAGLSFAAHVCNIGAVVAFGYDLGIEANVLTYFATVPIIFITASIPLFPGGWGVRETAFLVAFAAVGVPSIYEGRILLLSLLIGLALMAWSLLGGLFLFVGPRQDRVNPDEMAVPPTEG
jgi:glycosyltransferase 2 family protein